MHVYNPNNRMSIYNVIWLSVTFRNNHMWDIRLMEQLTIVFVNSPYYIAIVHTIDTISQAQCIPWTWCGQCSPLYTQFLCFLINCLNRGQFASDATQKMKYVVYTHHISIQLLDVITSQNLMIIYIVLYNLSYFINYKTDFIVFFF